MGHTGWSRTRAGTIGYNGVLWRVKCQAQKLEFPSLSNRTVIRGSGLIFCGNGAKAYTCSETQHRLERSVF